MKELKEAIKILEYDKKYRGLGNDTVNALQTLISFCERVVKCEGMPKRKEKYAYYDKCCEKDAILIKNGYNQAHDEMLIWHVKQMKKKVDVERIIEIMKSISREYGERSSFIEMSAKFITDEIGGKK